MAEYAVPNDDAVSKDDTERTERPAGQPGRADDAPLRGCTIGVTAERKAGEIGGLFERRGAQVRYGAAIHTVPLPDDGELARATDAVLAAPVDHTVAVTGVGFRGWVEAARHRGLEQRLTEHLAAGEVFARGAKARGAVRGAGLPDPWTAPSEESTEVLECLLSRGVSGARIALQIHGDPMWTFRERLTAAGAEVLPVAVYRWQDPVDLGALDTLIDAVLAGAVDALPFTSAPAATNLLERARARGHAADLHAVLREQVLLACVGPVTAAPLEAAGLPCVLPERARTAALVRLVTERLTGGPGCPA